MILDDPVEIEIKRLRERIDRLECLIHTAIEAMIKIAEAVDLLTEKKNDSADEDARRSRFS